MNVLKNDLGFFFLRLAADHLRRPHATSACCRASFLLCVSRLSATGTFRFLTGVAFPAVLQKKAIRLPDRRVLRHYLFLPSQRYSSPRPLILKSRPRLSSACARLRLLWIQVVPGSVGVEEEEEQM